MARLLTARCLALEVERRTSEFVVTLLPVVLGAVRLPFDTADRLCTRPFFDLIHRSLGVGDSTGDTSSNTTSGANTTTDSPKSNVKRNFDQDSRATLDRGSNGDSAEERLERDHIEGL